jgi:crossover junction endodeoxyribonuclease RuvC
MRILGVDPGLRRCGWGVVEHRFGRTGYVACGVIAPPTEAPLAERLATIHKGVAEILALHRPDEAAVEDSFVHANPASALKLGHARAAAMLAPALAGLTVAEYAPRLVKQAVTGKGGAEKEQVAAMVGMLLPGSRAVADAADALAVAICHAHHASTRARMGLAP